MMSLAIKKMCAVVGLALIVAQINGADAGVPADQDRCTAKMLALLKLSKPDFVEGADAVERAVDWSHFLRHPVRVEQGDNPHQLVAEDSRSCHRSTYETPEVVAQFRSVLVQHPVGLVWRHPRDGRQCFPGYVDGSTVVIKSSIWDKTTAEYKNSRVFDASESLDDWYSKQRHSSHWRGEGDRRGIETVIPRETFLEFTKDGEQSVNQNTGRTFLESMINGVAVKIRSSLML